MTAGLAGVACDLGISPSTPQCVHSACSLERHLPQHDVLCLPELLAFGGCELGSWGAG